MARSATEEDRDAGRCVAAEPPGLHGEVVDAVAIEVPQRRHGSPKAAGGYPGRLRRQHHAIRRGAERSGALGYSDIVDVPAVRLVGEGIGAVEAKSHENAPPERRVGRIGCRRKKRVEAHRPGAGPAACFAEQRLVECVARDLVRCKGGKGCAVIQRNLDRGLVVIRVGFGLEKVVERKPCAGGDRHA